MATEKSSLNEEMVPCGCGRSPTGYCCDLHNMSEEEYMQWMEAKFDDGDAG